MSFLSLLADVLFIGHSLVGPTMPAMVESTLRLMDEPARVEAQLINGAPLSWNWDNSADAEGVDGRARLAAGGVTDLILTEGIPLVPQIKYNDTPGKIADFAMLARQGNPQVKVWLYETWHSLASGPGIVIEGDAGSGVPWRARLTADLLLWEQAAADAGARGAGEVRIIPAGQALGLLADEIAAGRAPGLTSIRDLFNDDIHLNGKGQYFVALVQAAAITGRSPEGLPTRLTRNWLSRDAVISDDLAPVLQQLAWSAVQTQAARALPPAQASVPVADAPARQLAVAVDEPPALPEPPEDPPAPPPTPITNDTLGFGLAGVNDWSVQQPFLDLMKTHRPWTGHLPGRWGGFEEPQLRAGGWLDANGWPTGIPPEVSGLTTLVLTDLPEGAGGVAGRYVLTHAGQGELRIDGRAQVLAQDAQGAVFDYTPGPGGVLITILATDPADPIRDIVVVRQDRAEALAAGAMFNPDLLARLRGVKALRYMDWMATNNSTLATSADRPRPTDSTWARNGVPMEVMVALANELDADAWFTVPHLADDALVTELATMARDGLEPGRRAYVEFSNEVWNWQFAQAQWADAQGRERWNRDETWVQYYALRAAEVASIWARVYGAEAESRLIRVIGTQTGWLGLEELILAAPLVVAEGKAAPFESFDAYAVTGYFSGMLGHEEKRPAVKEWLALSEAAARRAAEGMATDAAEAHVAAHRYDLAVTLAAQELRDGSVTGDATDSLTWLLAEWLPYHAAVAADHRLDLVMYEGGTHVVGVGSGVDDPELTDFFVHLNYTAEMGGLYGDLLAGWRLVSAAPFMAFVDTYAPVKWGSWGAARHLKDDNPRWQALARGCGAC